MDVEDGNKLNILHNKWYEEDLAKTLPKVTLLQKLKNIFS